MSYLAGLLGLICGGLVVPVLEVLVYSGLLRSFVLLQHGRQTSFDLGGVAMHGLVELCIAGVVLLLERNGRHFVNVRKVRDPDW